jgi:hypothetical protein
MSSYAIGIDVSPANVIEKEFMRALINRILSIDAALTCPDDVDDEYDVETVTTSHTPTFRIYANGTHFYTIQRGATLANNASTITALAIVNGNVYRSVELNWGGTWAYTATATRIITLAYIATEGFYLLNLHGTPSWGEYPICDSILVESHDTTYGTNQFGARALKSTQYIPSVIFNISALPFYGANDSAVGKFVSRFAYKSPAGYLDYVKSSVYAYDNNGVLSDKLFDLTPLYDCSEVTAGSTLALDDGQYIAVGTNQLVKVAENT